MLEILAVAAALSFGQLGQQFTVLQGNTLTFDGGRSYSSLGSGELDLTYSVAGPVDGGAATLTLYLIETDPANSMASVNGGVVLSSGAITANASNTLVTQAAHTGAAKVLWQVSGGSFQGVNVTLSAKGAFSAGGAGGGGGFFVDNVTKPKYVCCGATATAFPAALSGRTGVTVCDQGPNPINVGDNTVSVLSGLWLTPGECGGLTVDAGTTLYCVSSVAQTDGGCSPILEVSP